VSDLIICQALDPRCSAWSITTPKYCKPFIDKLKASVPSNYRTWSPLTKAWGIDGEWVHHAADIAKEYFPDADVRWNEGGEDE
jgi:hypothetical protein